MWIWSLTHKTDVKKMSGYNKKGAVSELKVSVSNLEIINQSLPIGYDSFFFFIFIFCINIHLWISDTRVIFVKWPISCFWCLQHEYMGYMEKKTTKRKTTIITLSDHNKEEIRNIDFQKQNMEEEFNQKKQGVCQTSFFNFNFPNFLLSLWTNRIHVLSFDSKFSEEKKIFDDDSFESNV